MAKNFSLTSSCVLTHASPLQLRAMRFKAQSKGDFLSLASLVFLGFLIAFYASVSMAEGNVLSEKQYTQQLVSIIKITQRKIKIKKENFLKNTPKDKKLCDKDCIKSTLKHLAEIDQIIRLDVWQSPIVQEMMRQNIFEKNSGLLFKITEKIDSDNTAELKRLLAITPWFKISEFGKEAANNAWTIVQHSPDIDLQHRVLFILEHLPKHEISLQDYALLYDKICLAYQDLGIKQRYGTQFLLNKGVLKMYSYEGTWLELNKRRKAMGLDSMESYITQLKEAYPLVRITKS